MPERLELPPCGNATAAAPAEGKFSIELWRDRGSGIERVLAAMTACTPPAGSTDWRARNIRIG